MKWSLKEAEKKQKQIDRVKDWYSSELNKLDNKMILLAEFQNNLKKKI